MNLGTFVTLAIVAIALAFALRSIFKKKGGCSCSDCSHCSSSQACPSAQMTERLAELDEAKR